MCAMKVDWKAELNECLTKHAGKRVNGKVASLKTAQHTRDVAFNFMNTLHDDLGLAVERLQNVRRKHLVAVFQHWYHVKKLKAKTLQDYASRLRILFGYIGKPDFVENHANYLPAVDPAELIVRAAAKTSKSWAAAGVDFVVKVKEIDARDWRLGVIVRGQLLFGFRRKEGIRFIYQKCVTGDYVRVYAGQGKGNRERVIPIETEAQRQWLAYVKEKVGVTVRLGWPTTGRGKIATLDQCDKRYSNLMYELGLTDAVEGVVGHGLRGQYAENQALMEGLVPPTLGGDPKVQMEGEDLDGVRTRISLLLGHSRKSITSAYLGSFAKRAEQDEKSFQERLAGAIKVLGETERITFPGAEHLEDCLLIASMATIDKVSLGPSEAYALWKQVSLRHGATWMAPERNVREYLDAAAFDIINSHLKAA